MTNVTKTLIAAAAVLTVGAGSALAQSGGYYDYHYAPGASDYSNTRIVEENAAPFGTSPQVAFVGQSRPTTAGTVVVDRNEPPVIFAGSPVAITQSWHGLKGLTGDNLDVAESR